MSTTTQDAHKLSIGDFRICSANMLRRRDQKVSIDNESGEVLADKKVPRISMNHPFRLVGQHQPSPGCCQDCCCNLEESERKSHMKMTKFRINSASSEHQDYPEMSLNKSESVELSPSFKKTVKISIFKEFLLGDQVFDKMFEEAEFQKMMSNKKMRMGSFKRNISTSKVMQFIKHRIHGRIMCIIFLMMLYTFFFIVPEYCPFAISFLLFIKFAYYNYMHKKIHERADMLGITPVFTGTIFASGLIWVARKNCSICKENELTDAVFKYYKGSTNEGIKTGCSLPLLP